MKQAFRITASVPGVYAGLLGKQYGAFEIMPDPHVVTVATAFGPTPELL